MIAINSRIGTHVQPVNDRNLSMSNERSSWPISTGHSMQENIQDTSQLFKDALTHFQSFLKPPKSVESLDKAISKARMSVSNSSKDNPELPLRALGLGEMLHYRYQERLQRQDLTDALGFGEKAYASMNEGCDAFVSCLWLQGVLYDSEYQATGHEVFLNSALEKIEGAIQRAPHDLAYLQACTMILIHRYEHFGHDEIGSLLRALKYANSILESPVPDLWANALHHRSLVLLFLHEEEPHSKLIASALADAREFVGLKSDGDPDKPRALQALAYALQKSFEYEGRTKDLSDGIELMEGVVHSLGQDDSLWCTCLNNLSLMYENRYEVYSEQKDLEKAISFSEKALGGMASGDPRKVRWTANFANQLGRYFSTTGRSEYLDRAISKLRDISSSRSLRPRDQIEASSDLARFLVQRGRREDTADLDEAIALLQDCLRSFSKDDLNRLRHLTRYIHALAVRYRTMTKSAASSEDLDSANEAMSMMPASHRQRADWLETLATFWHARFRLSQALEDLEKAFSICRDSVESSSKDHPSRYHRKFMLAALGWELHSLYQMDGRTERALQSYERAVVDCVQVAESPYSSFWCRVMAARVAIKMLGKTSQWHRMMTIGAAAIRLLPILCSRYQSREEQTRYISWIYGIASETCSACIRAGRWEDGLRYLEFGRGILIGHTIDNRSDLNALHNDHPDIAGEYETLRTKLLRSHETGQSNVPDVILREGRELFTKMEACLDRIRKYPEYATFLDIPDIGELQDCAVEGPIVVVNHTILSSDAILVLRDTTIALSLPKMQEKVDDAPFGSDSLWGFDPLEMGTELTRHISACSESDSEEYTDGNFLQWLWRTCVGPVLDELAKKGALSADNDKQRTWWIGSGNAASYPFHAAVSGACISDDSALSRTIPSYVPSIKALSYARQQCHNALEGMKSRKPKLLLVSMPTTPGKKSLPGAEREAKLVEGCCSKAFTIEKISNPTAELTMQRLKDSNLVHFACHGVSDPEDPSMSRLLLERDQKVDPLDVSRMATMEKSKVAWIAYLSACSTAETKHQALAEEGIHMASALLLAGFPHVVGSLWQVDDDVSVYMTKCFYEALVHNKEEIHESRTIAEAWRSAVIRTRENLQLDPEVWAVYVHFGC